MPNTKCGLVTNSGVHLSFGTDVIVLSVIDTMMKYFTLGLGLQNSYWFTTKKNQTLTLTVLW